MKDESKNQYNYIAFERQIDSGIIRINNENIIVINVCVSQSEKVEQFIKLLTRL